MDRDMRPTRFDLSLEYTREFVNEWFDQNPLGQIGIVGMRMGVAERIGELSGKPLIFLYLFLDYMIIYLGNPHDVLKAISERHKLEPAGDPSLQNAVELARSSMRFVRRYEHSYFSHC
jgi:transcription initiation factor TFIIH subunit 2